MACLPPDTRRRSIIDNSLDTPERLKPTRKSSMKTDVLLSPPQHKEHKTTGESTSPMAREEKRKEFLSNVIKASKVSHSIEGSCVSSISSLDDTCDDYGNYEEFDEDAFTPEDEEKNPDVVVVHHKVYRRCLVNEEEKEGKDLNDDDIIMFHNRMPAVVVTTSSCCGRFEDSPGTCSTATNSESRWEPNNKARAVQQEDVSPITPFHESDDAGGDDEYRPRNRRNHRKGRFEQRRHLNHLDLMEGIMAPRRKSYDTLPSMPLRRLDSTSSL